VFDEDLLKDYENLKSHDTEHNLTIFHLIGQHVNYRTRYPQKQRHFTGDDYKELKPNLNARERKILSDYDNACLYNDSVVDQIIKRFEKEDAIVIYMSDHGEECYEGDMHFICRMHSAAIDYRLAHAEFDIPFWIWCSRSYAKKRPEIFRQIREAKNKKFMTDALPHLLLYLGGIHSKDYHEEYNLISPKYNENRPRILKGTTDYDKLKKETK
jgi:heptose-I-phosphate ethanolaminephosphotransferase